MSVSISSPVNNSTIGLGTTVSVAANVTQVGVAVTSVEFLAGSQLIGTSTVAPYAIVWGNMEAGTYSLTARAKDNNGGTVTSSPVRVKVSKALRSVRTNRTNATELTNSGSLSTSEDALQTASALDVFVTDLQKTYNDFSAEAHMFSSADQIERYLFAALFLAQSSNGLTKEATPTSGVIDRLNKVEAYLSFCEDLMVSDMISSKSLNDALKVGARTNLQIGQTSATPLSTTGLIVSPNGGAKILTTPLRPFGTLTATASTGGAAQYELGDLTVTVNGRGAALLTVSPTQITFTMPSDTSGGLADILVTSRQGFITHGTAAVTGLNPTIFGRTGNASDVGAVLDAVGFQSGIFPVTGSGMFLTDLRTRLTILTSGISTGVANTNTSNDVFLANGQTIANLAESVTVEARASNGSVFMLPVEFAGAQGTLAGLEQVNVVLLPELRGAGSVQLTVIVNGVRSNAMKVNLE